MVLVDTSVWVSHLRDANARLETLLNQGVVVCHPFVIGELACGNLRNRVGILSLLQLLPAAEIAEQDEVLQFIGSHRLMGKGLGFIDMHLLSSAALSGVPLWTLDRRLNQISAKLKVGYEG